MSLVEVLTQMCMPRSGSHTNAVT